MTSNDRRAETLVRALRAGIEGDRETIVATYTEDVRAWTPAASTGSLIDLVAQFDHRDDAFSDIALDVAPLDVGGDYACAEWTVSMTHTGPLEVAAGGVVDATGVRVTFNGVTVAEFRNDRICSLRQYWDEITIFEQLGVFGPDDA